MPPSAIRLFVRKRPTPAQVRALYADAPWAKKRTKAAVARMLKTDQLWVTAWKGPQLVGMARGFSDGVFRGVLWDVIVARVHRGEGLGRKMVREMLRQPSMKKLEQVWLFTRNPNFYASLGFKKGGHGVMIRRIR